MVGSTNKSHRICRVALAALVLASGVAVAQEQTLKAGVFIATHSAQAELFLRFIEQVNLTGRGVVQIRLVGGPEAIPTTELGNALSTGVLDIAALPPAFYANRLPEADAVVLSSLNAAERRKSGAWAALNRLHNMKLGAWYLAGYGDGVRFHIWTTRAVGSSDFSGFRLRTAPTYTDFFRALGAAPISIAPGEVQVALDRKLIDGYGFPSVGVFELGWADATRFRIDPGFYNVVISVLANLKSWQGLRQDQREVLTRAGEWLETESVRWVDARVRAEQARLEAAGIKVVDLGDAFRRRAYAVYWAELAKRAPESIAILRPLLEH